MTTEAVHPQPNPTPPRPVPKIRIPRTRVPLAAAWITAITTLLLLTGCTTDTTPPTASGPVAGQSPATTQVATPPPSPDPAPVPAYAPATADGPAQNVPTPVLPEKAKEFSKEGLEAFARHWYTTLGYAYETGDVAPMTAITALSCSTCAEVMGSTKDWYSKGGWIVGGQMTVHSSTSTFYQTPDGSYQSILMIQQAKVTSYHADKTLDSDLPPRKARADIVVATYSDGKWTVQKAEHLAKD